MFKSRLSVSLISFSSIAVLLFLGSTTLSTASTANREKPSATTKPTPTPALSPSPENTAEIGKCTECHSELTQSRLRNPAIAVINDVHAKASMKCWSCHGGDPTSVLAVNAHSRNFIARPDFKAQIALCGGCHAEPLANFQKGKHHLAATSRKPNCVTCHGAHGVATPSVEMISEPLCSSCHQVGQARRIYKALKDAEDAIASTDEIIQRTGDGGELKKTLFDSRTKMRGLSHKLDLLEITRSAAAVISGADKIRAEAEPRIKGIAWGKFLRAAGIVLGIILLAAVGAAAWFTRRKWLRPNTFKLPKGKKQRIFIIAIAVVGAIGAVAAWQMNQYIEHNPNFCTSCHTMKSAFDLWESSAHKNVECHTCHPADVAANLHQLWFYVTKRPDEVVHHAYVDRKICEQCHTEGPNKTKWDKIAKTPGHIKHVENLKIECVQCHGNSLHKFRPDKDLCAGCHKAISLASAGGMAEMHCTECHKFTVVDPKKSLKPDRAACLDCHQSMQMKGETFPEKAPMSWVCSECHKPHEKIRIGTAECKNCHSPLKGLHKTAAHAKANCIECHKPHGWKIEPRKTCTTCHTDRSKHYPEDACVSCHEGR